MEETRPSQTASFVALWRALAHQGFSSAQTFSDPVVASLLSPGWSLAHRLIERRLRRHRPERLAFAIKQFDVIALRVLAIDLELARALEAGVRQLVVLGAGLDTRAFRLSSLGDVAVYEVDHPATQAYKRRKTSALTPLSRSLHFVAVDFERESLGPKLAAAGHRADQPTVWIWEGVVMYLGDEALRQTLESIASASVAGSKLLIHYHEPFSPGEEAGREQLVRKLLLRFWKEPQIGLRAPTQMQSEVRRVGFEIERDTRPSAWADELGAGAPEGQTAGITHLLVARRT